LLENLITDRTLADYTRWRTLRDKGYENMTEAERAEWSGTMKGAYNYTDLNRVGAALNYLRDRLTDAGYLLGIEFNAVTNWTSAQIPTAAQFTAYIKAVETIRSALTQKATTPRTPNDTGSLDIQGANDIESILLDIEDLINKMIAARNFCGELYCGEV
jgi:hypothetical protein